MTPWPILNFIIWAIVCIVLLVILLAVLDRRDLIYVPLPNYLRSLLFG